MFRGNREVEVVEPEGGFRRLASGDAREVLVHGAPLGVDDAALAGRDDFTSLAGRFLVLVHEPGARRLTLHTDRHGLLPLYVARGGDRLHLACRIGPLLARARAPRELDWETLAELLAFHMTLGPGTLLRGVEAVEPGAWEIDLDTLERTRRGGWDPAAAVRGADLALADVADELIERFLEAHRIALAGARAVAVTLSGGMDTRCLLAAALHLGHRPAAVHVAVPGSRAHRYATRIARECDVPLHAFPLDASFGALYPDLLERVALGTDGMKIVPQPEMLWLRDQVDADAAVLHGAFGELAKLRVLRDYALDDALAAGGRGELPDLLWTRRFEGRFRSYLRVFAPEARRRLEAADPRARLRAALEGEAADLDVAEVLQVRYLRDFLRSSRYGHQLWNQRVATRFPFLDAGFVDLLLRVRTEDRVEQGFQLRFLERVAPELRALPDENTGTGAGAPRLLARLVRAADLARIALFDSKVEANHGDLVEWLRGAGPAADRAVAELAGAGEPGARIFDPARPTALLEGVRGYTRRRGPQRVLALRRARADALTLQAFWVVALASRAFFGGAAGGE